MTISDADGLDTAAQDGTVFHMDEAAFRGFYERTARPLWAYLYRLTRDPGRADDLLQDTYFRFLRAADAPDDEAHRRNYVFRIATNLVRDERRRSRPQQMTSVDAAGELAEASQPSTADAAMLRTDVGRAMSRLSDRERELLWMAYAEGATHREIASVLGLKVGSIKLLLFRARRRLADVMKRWPAAPAGGGAQ